MPSAPSIALSGGDVAGHTTFVATMLSTQFAVIKDTTTTSRGAPHGPSSTPTTLLTVTSFIPRAFATLSTSSTGQLPILTTHTSTSTTFAASTTALPSTQNQTTQFIALEQDFLARQFSHHQAMSSHMNDLTALLQIIGIDALNEILTTHTSNLYNTELDADDNEVLADAAINTGI